MIDIRSAAIAIIASAAGLAAASLPSAAATVVPYGGVGQHATVMKDIARTQQRNDAAIGHVQNNIRSTRPKTY